ncbi:MAG: DEAD/DEAH box helicase [Defluviitaleaceae bacterium]|nr:DEAD/DEAH box helicase [Defluviitaleaceae bacterium]
MTKDIQQTFSAPTIQWFDETLGKPTKVQQEAWPAIAFGQHVLVSAPTGTGKTLSAFLVFIDQMMVQAHAGTLEDGLQLIYISPLKSLAGDIRENLYRPLNGIAKGIESLSPIKVAVRTGDTSTTERTKMAKKPPHILITTPESLYLLLTAKTGQHMLRTAKTIIIDELHAMLDTKRGAHMMLSLARLDALCGRPLQRVGLSATIQPLELSADYLSNGVTPVKIVAPVMHKNFEIKIINPFPGGILPEGTIWPEIAKKVVESCEDARSVIAFTEGRLMAEQLAFYVNKLQGEGFARTHHGSVSKEQRFEVENDLRAGNLRLLCATSSMELGIDVGEIDRVLQVACPLSISSVMQRLGRAGHNPGRLSAMEMYPRTVAENLYCALTAQTARDGGIEPSKPPRFCFDVLAQHLVSMSVSLASEETISGYLVDDVMKLLSHAHPFREVTKEDVCAILQMLAGDYEHAQDIPVRPRVNYDRINGRVEGDAYSRMLAVSAGGTIPDTGKFTAKTEGGVKIGELDEEFVFEQRIGFKFLLGSFAWKITGINKDTVTVAQTSSEGARPPFWRMQIGQGRKLETGIAFGKHMRMLTEAAYISVGDGRKNRDDNNDEYSEELLAHLKTLGLDQNAACDTADFIMRQIAVTKLLPSDQTIIAEHFVDEVGLHQIMFHSIFGRQVNAPLAILLSAVAKNLTGMDVDCYDDDDGVLLMARGEQPLPEGLLQAIRPETCKTLLEAALPGTPIFNIAFRHNAGRALMMGVRRNKRNPLWIQRLRASEMLDSAIQHDTHPLMRETKRECLEDYWDLSALEKVLTDIKTKAIQVTELFSEEPSPLCLPLRRASEAIMMYAYHPSTENVIATADIAVQGVLSEKLKPNTTQLERVSERNKLPENEQGLHTLLMIEGDLIAGELPLPLEWFEFLAEKNRCLYIEPGLWIAAEHQDMYYAALVSDIGNDKGEARQNIVRRALRYRGAMDVAQLAERYFWSEGVAQSVLDSLCNQGSVIFDNGFYYHAELYERARRATITERRQVQTVPAANYAALISAKTQALAPPTEQLKQAIQRLSSIPHPAPQWEQSLLPARVNHYRPELLNNLLSTGEFFWTLQNNDLIFHPYADIDWDADISQSIENIMPNLDPDEQAILQFLQKRGASFLTATAVQIQQPLQSVLFSLMEKSLIHADSFTPIRIWQDRAKSEKLSPRRKAAASAATTSAGRWDIVRPLKSLNIEERINRAFDKTPILSRETAIPLLGIPWSAALEALRTWEYTGRARRGYFVEGLSGAQYIREDAYVSVIQELRSPVDKIIWLTATDPNQVWGKALPYDIDRKFTSVHGTVVAIKQGEPLAVFERKGHTLRVFNEIAIEDGTLTDALIIFAEAFRKKNILPTLNRITIKQYPPETVQALTNAGFRRIMFDYELHR